jgi:hypothetical protein
VGEGGLVALQSLLNLKKGTRTFNFQSNEPPLKFMRQPFHINCLWKNKNIEALWLLKNALPLFCSMSRRTGEVPIGKMDVEEVLVYLSIGLVI